MNTPLLPDIIDGVLPRYANSGGPMSRTRKERIRSSLLGSDGGVIRCPSLFRLGLRFTDTHPVSCLEALLRDEGYSDPEELRDKYELPEGKLVCMPCAGGRHRLNVYRESPRDVLGQALMLGLCTAQLFDPARPVLWTEASLTRSLELFDPRGFYT
jgi:hypothetical protein